MTNEQKEQVAAPATLGEIDEMVQWYKKLRDSGDLARLVIWRSDEEKLNLDHEPRRDFVAELRAQVNALADEMKAKSTSTSVTFDVHSTSPEESAAWPWVQGEDYVNPGWPLITDIHQLYALRPGAIILGGGSTPEAYRKQQSASGAYWARFDVTIDTQTADITLPATLLYEPEESA